MKTITTYFKGVLSEMRKVTWPTRAEVVNHTIIVIISAGLAIGITMALDYGLSKLIKLIIQNNI
jgi:preprotein translocase subunit SecE